MGDKTSINIRELDNGFLVSIHVMNGGDPFIAGETKEFYCMDLNQVNSRINKAYGETDNG